MKKLLTLAVAFLFAFSLTGLSFAEEQAAPAAEKPKVEEKAPVKAEKKAKKAKKSKKAEKKPEEKKEGEAAPAAK
jgi:hypothetical protein